MLKPWRVCFALAVSSVGFSSALASTTYDDFTAKWRALSFGFGTTISNVRDRLEITLEADAEGPEADFFARGLASACAVSGDFDLRVKYRLLDWPAGNGARMSLYIGNPAAIVAEEGVWIERDSFSATEGGPREVYVFFSLANQEPVAEAATADMNGVLRLVRVGSTATGYYKQGTSWVALGSSPVGTQALRFALLVLSHDSVFADMPVRAAFDAVRLVAGTLTGSACPFASD